MFKENRIIHQQMNNPENFPNPDSLPQGGIAGPKDTKEAKKLGQKTIDDANRLMGLMQKDSLMKGSVDQPSKKPARKPASNINSETVNPVTGFTYGFERHLEKTLNTNEGQKPKDLKLAMETAVSESGWSKQQIEQWKQAAVKNVEGMSDTEVGLASKKNIEDIKVILSNFVEEKDVNSLMNKISSKYKNEKNKSGINAYIYSVMSFNKVNSLAGFERKNDEYGKKPKWAVDPNKLDLRFDTRDKARNAHMLIQMIDQGLI